MARPASWVGTPVVGAEPGRHDNAQVCVDLGAAGLVRAQHIGITDMLTISHPYHSGMSTSSSHTVP